MILSVQDDKVLVAAPQADLDDVVREIRTRVTDEDWFDFIVVEGLILQRHEHRFDVLL